MIMLKQLFNFQSLIFLAVLLGLALTSVSGQTLADLAKEERERDGPF